MKLSDTAYNVLKWVIALVLPAAAVLYGTLGPDWGWFNPELIVKTITAIQLFLGTIFGISCYQYAQQGK
jgi:hypothetical protein